MKALLIALLFFPCWCLAQVVNIESERGGDKQGFHAAAEGGVNLQSGNVSVFQYQLGLRLDYINGLHHYLGNTSLSYGESEGKAFQDQSYAHLRWTAMWREHVGTEVFTQSQSAKFQLLQLRQLLGGGLRFTLLNDLVALGVGGMSDYEVISGAQGGSLVARGTSYLRLNKEWENGVKGQWTTYYQPQFFDLSDYRILSTGSLEFLITKIFSVINEVNYSYDTRPPQDVVNNDLQIKIKLKARW